MQHAKVKAMLSTVSKLSCFYLFRKTYFTVLYSVVNLELGFKPYKLAVIIWIMVDQVAHGSGKRNLAYSLVVQPSTQQQEIKTISPNPISSNIGNLTEGHHVKSK